MVDVDGCKHKQRTDRNTDAKRNSINFIITFSYARQSPASSLIPIHLPS